MTGRLINEGKGFNPICYNDIHEAKGMKMGTRIFPGLKKELPACTWPGVLLPVFLVGILLGGCQTSKITIRPEPVLPEEEAKVRVENLYQKGQAELEKFTIPGYKEAIKYFEQTLHQQPDFYQAYGRLAVAYGLWARERKELGLGNLDQWVKGSFYASKAEELGLHQDYLKASALVLNSKTFITDYEYGEIFRSYYRHLRGEPAERLIPYLKDLFESGSFKSGTVNPALKNLEAILKDNPEEAEALARGWTKKVERLAERKKELEAKITYCQELLASK